MAARQPLCRLMLIVLAALLLLSPLIASPAVAAAPLQQVCYDLVANGGFETPSVWVLGSGPLPPTYTASQPRTGAWAMQIGNVSPATAAIEAYSSVRQSLTIPANAISAELTFWAWTFTEASPGSDRQEALLLVPGASVQSSSPTIVWSELSNSGTYRPIRVSVASQIGRTVDLTFSVYNDGFGGRTWMLVDDVALVVCVPSGTATPTATPTFLPTPTATPLPTPIITPGPIPPGCYDILQNGDFEWTGAWQFGDTALPPFYAGAPPTPPSGSRMMALGAILPGAPTNIPSYSSIQQAVTIPASAQTASIRFQYYPISNASGGFNRQELVLLDPLNYDETIEVLWRVTNNANRWLFDELDLTRHIGRTVTIYFNARNAGDGRRTAMYLDEVQLLVCDATVAMPWPEHPIWIETSPPVFTPTPTPHGTEQAMDHIPEPGNQQTVIAVGTKPLPLDEITPGPLASPIATPDQRRDGGLGAGIDLSASPWVVILVISAVILLAAVLALLFFRNER